VFLLQACTVLNWDIRRMWRSEALLIIHIFGDYASVSYPACMSRNIRQASHGPYIYGSYLGPIRSCFIVFDACSSVWSRT